MPETKLILGTASFGSDYGIKHDGQPSIQGIEEIARIARDGGIRVIHTSWQYNLPKICEAIFNEFEWIKKDKAFPNLFSWESEYSLGMSIYDPIEYHHFIGAEQVMVPINILDHRFLGRKHNFILIARSVFLQGLLLMEVIDLPKWIPPDTALQISRFQAMAWTLDLWPYEAALGYILGLDEVDHVIVGVNSAKQLEQLLAVKPLIWDHDFSIGDEMVLDPRRWPA